MLSGGCEGRSGQDSHLWSLGQSAIRSVEEPCAGVQSQRLCQITGVALREGMKGCLLEYLGISGKFFSILFHSFLLVLEHVGAQKHEEIPGQSDFDVM